MEEKRVRKEELESEIYLALKDYFEGRFEKAEGGVEYVLPNGQIFKICVIEK